MKLVSALVGTALALGMLGNAMAEGKSSDPYLWLEETRGARATDWVRSRTEATLAELRSDPTYSDMLAGAEQILSSHETLPADQVAGPFVFGIGQDRDSRRGVWRRASLSAYEAGSPDWEALLDLDDVSRRERKDWQWRGAKCLPPEFTKCLVFLSRTAETRVVVREFDVATRSFVAGGFETPEGNTLADWLDADTLIVASDRDGGASTRSGNPRTIRIWNRGSRLASARTLYSGDPGDDGITPRVFRSLDGKPTVFIVRRMQAGSSQVFHVDGNLRVLRISLPPSAQVLGLHRRQVVAQLGEDWSIAGTRHPRGAIVAVSLDKYMESGGAMPRIQPVFTPDERTSISGAAVGSETVYVTTLENVNGRVYELAFDGTVWVRRRLSMPDKGSISIISSSCLSGAALLKFSSFLTPDSMYLVRKGGEPGPVRQLQARFNAANTLVEQYDVASRDGTRIPYFVVRKAGSEQSGNTPTLLYAYGGFNVSTTPWYWSSAGKLWLENGGAYVVANIRGGGEFGADWHAAATGENRQRNFDDLAAVAQDLVARGLTSPRRLGVFGSSQGGLLVTGAAIQHPELFSAVVSQLPLTDMLRYTVLSAGQGWTSEYGDPSDPRMRDIISQWSPYQNVKPGVQYPKVLLLASSAEGSVHPAHARKMAAKLEALGQDVLFYEDAKPADLSHRAEQLALTFTYLRRELMARPGLAQTAQKLDSVADGS